MRRTALPDPPMPFSPGFEVAGTVVAAGPGVDPATVGGRVVGTTACGGYAEMAVMSAASALPRPDGLDDHTALALLGQGSAAAFDLLTPGTGRMVVYGTTSRQAPSFDPLAVYQRGVSVIGFASMALGPERRAELREEAFSLAAAGDLTPIIGAVLPLSEAAAAPRAFEQRTAIGKTILTP